MIVLPRSPGRSAADAWPGLDRDDAVDLVEPRDSPIPARIDGLVRVVDRAADGEGVTLVAHSLGAVSTVLALPRVPRRIHRLVLVEPALYDVARGDPAVEHHIAVMTEARELLASDGLEAYWGVVRPVMFGGPAAAEAWGRERDRAEAFSRVPVPWGHGIRASAIDGIDTLVVTGGWSDEYEAIAAVLTGNGATHRVLAGSGHRPQDQPAFADLLREGR